ncbi:MAG: zinc ribbon domain-containing protein [Planctomycetes bacterium]|nr:zinc ribbon domain-containing protein [Planctomycetota bacterium]MBL7146254.1 zinc ribbon domain-containing protein [Phycisphaerae bacterium]
MPTYEYICESCGCGFEQFQSITAKSLRTCPKCGKRKLKRLIGAGAGVIFKGSGFYQTDYRSEGYKKDKEGEKKTTDKGAGKKETETKTTETKTTETKTKDSKSEKKNISGTKDKKNSA